MNDDLNHRANTIMGEVLELTTRTVHAREPHDKTSEEIDYASHVCLKHCQAHLLGRTDANRRSISRIAASFGIDEQPQLGLADMIAALVLLRQRQVRFFLWVLSMLTSDSEEILTSQRSARALEHTLSRNEMMIEKQYNLIQDVQTLLDDHDYVQQSRLTLPVPNNVQIDSSAVAQKSRRHPESEDTLQAGPDSMPDELEHNSSRNEYEFDAWVLLKNEKQDKWAPVRVLKDSGCETNIITGRILEQSDVYKELLSRPEIFRGFSNATHPSYFEMTLSWRHERTGEETQDRFAVFEDAPYDMVLGRQYLLETHVLQPIARLQRDRSSALVLQNWRMERSKSTQAALDCELWLMFSVGERSVQAEQEAESKRQAERERDAHLAKLREERRLKQSSGRSQSTPASSSKPDGSSLNASENTGATSTVPDAQSTPGEAHGSVSTGPASIE